MKIQLIVGLGNPGPQYTQTRHNVGFWLVEQLCNSLKTPIANESKFKGYIASATYGNQPLKILAPMTYMNRSGESVLAVSKFYKIPPEEILVVHDELDLPPGVARLKLDGGHGGHNGLGDIIAHLGTKKFYRLRLGIGHPGDKDDVTNYVLERPNKADNAKIVEAIDASLAVFNDLLAGNFEKAMTTLHTATK
jgi:PTH1 family peptidyl-tRNA hydrolase